MGALTRRVLLAAVALVAACYYLVTQLPVDRQEFYGYVVASVLLVLLAGTAAFGAAALWQWVSNWRRRRRQDSS